MNPLTLIATTPMGLESVVKREVEALGFHARSENGKVVFEGPPEAICQANLWLRAADRVLVRVGSFRAPDADALFDGVRALPWEEWIPRDGAFPVEARLVDSQLRSVPVTQASVKKAIADRLGRHYGLRTLPESGAPFAVEIALRNDVAELTLDTSGAPLHRRGWRLKSVEAPIKETLAAAMVMISRWDASRPLLDPCCGSGTLPIEAALIGRNIAPGLSREFAAEQWPTLPLAVWKKARHEAREKMTTTSMDILGSDIDPRAVAVARSGMKRAGLGEAIRWEARPLTEVTMGSPFVCMLVNPPYGDRLGDGNEVMPLYAELGDLFERLDRASAFVLTPHPEFERAFGWAADRRRKLYNGRIECQLFQYLGPLPPRPGREG